MSVRSVPLVLDARATRAALSLTPLLDALRRALIAISRGEVSAPARIAARTERGLLGAMPAYVPGLGLAAKLVTVYASDSSPGRGEHQGVVVLFDEQDGRPLAIMDAEPLTAVRTAATATLAMHALARPGADRIAVIGAGAQARAQLALLAELRPSASVRVAARDLDRVRAAAKEFPGAQAATTVAAAIDGADVVFCCTDTSSPVVAVDDIAPGVHLSSVGGSLGPEFEPALLERARVFTEWRGAVTEPPPAGAHELQGADPGVVTELGAVLDAAAPGRARPEEITVFKSTGHAALDVAAARVVFDHVRS